MAAGDGHIHFTAFGRLLGTYGTTIKHPEENPPT